MREAKERVLYSPGMRLRIRDAEWFVKQVTPVKTGGHALYVRGITSPVQGRDQIFGTKAESDGTEDQLKAIDAFKDEVKSEIEIFQTALREYGLGMSPAGQCLANSVKVLECDMKIAMNSVEIARLKEDSQKCTNGHCEECSYYQDCKRKEEKETEE